MATATSTRPEDTAAAAAASPPPCHRVLSCGLSSLHWGLALHSTLTAMSHAMMGVLSQCAAANVSTCLPCHSTDAIASPANVPWRDGIQLHASCLQFPDYLRVQRVPAARHKPRASCITSINSYISKKFTQQQSASFPTLHKLRAPLRDCQGLASKHAASRCLPAELSHKHRRLLDLSTLA